MQSNELMVEIATKNNLELTEDNEKYILPYFYDDIDYVYKQIHDTLTIDVFIYMYKNTNKKYGVVYFNFNLPKYNVKVNDMYFMASLRDFDFAIYTTTDLESLKPSIIQQIRYTVNNYFLFYESYQRLKVLQTHTKIYINEIKSDMNIINGIYLNGMGFEASSITHTLSYRRFTKNEDVTQQYRIVMEELDKIAKELNINEIKP